MLEFEEGKCRVKRRNRVYTDLSLLFKDLWIVLVRAKAAKTKEENRFLYLKKKKKLCVRF